MPTNTVQVLVLMSHSQKLRLARKAKEAKLTMGELLRRGGERQMGSGMRIDLFAHA